MHGVAYVVGDFIVESTVLAKPENRDRDRDRDQAKTPSETETTR